MVGRKVNFENDRMVGRKGYCIPRNFVEALDFVPNGRTLMFNAPAMRRGRMSDSAIDPSERYP